MQVMTIATSKPAPNAPRAIASPLLAAQVTTQCMTMKTGRKEAPHRPEDLAGQMRTPEARGAAGVAGATPSDPGGAPLSLGGVAGLGQVGGVLHDGVASVEQVEVAALDGRLRLAPSVPGPVDRARGGSARGGDLRGAARDSGRRPGGRRCIARPSEACPPSPGDAGRDDGGASPRRVIEGAGFARHAAFGAAYEGYECSRAAGGTPSPKPMPGGDVEGRRCMAGWRGPVSTGVRGGPARRPRHAAAEIFGPPARRDASEARVSGLEGGACRRRRGGSIARSRGRTMARGGPATGSLRPRGGCGACDRTCRHGAPGFPGTPLNRRVLRRDERYSRPGAESAGIMTTRLVALPAG